MGAGNGAEDNKVDYLFGLAKNKRLITKIGTELDQARDEMKKTGTVARVFADFTWSTLKSWSAKRRVVAKAEVLPPTDKTSSDPEKPTAGKANPALGDFLKGFEEFAEVAQHRRAGDQARVLGPRQHL